MGPAFSLLVVLVFGTPVALLIFALCKFFLSFRPAIFLTGATLAGGAAGLFGGLIVQSLSMSETLETRGEVLLFLGIGCLTGAFGALLAGWIAWRLLASGSRTGRHP